MQRYAFRAQEGVGDGRKGVTLSNIFLHGLLNRRRHATLDRNVAWPSKRPMDE